MEKLLFTGASTALVTPFIHGKLNLPMVDILVRRQIDAGIHTIVVAGTTGEAPTLSDEEKILLFQRCKQAAGNDALIIAGTGSNDTAHAVRLSIAAQKVGADGVLVVSPYYNKANAEGLFSHYFAVANSITIPVIIYNVPSRTGLDIPVSVYQRLSRLDNIAGVKEASTDITKITKIRKACPNHFGIWSGNDEHTVPVIALGGHGIISVTANVCPEEVSSMAQAALDGNYLKAASMQAQLQKMNELMFCEVNPIPVKAAMKEIGFDCGDCRLPLCGLSPENQRKIEAYFQ